MFLDYSNVTVLFGRSNSIYKELGCNVYDINRNALNFDFDSSVICHPPCRSWGNLRHMAKFDKVEHDYAYYCLDIVRNYGGVIEHPVRSLFFKSHLPLPGHFDEFGGFTISINLNWFGYPAEKKTLLYICGLDYKLLPEYSLSFNAISHVVGSCYRSGKKISKLPEIPKSLRDHTPKALALYLIDIIQLMSL